MCLGVIWRTVIAIDPLRTLVQALEEPVHFSSIGVNAVNARPSCDFRIAVNTANDYFEFHSYSYKK
jgi:hypothetical protein